MSTQSGNDPLYETMQVGPPFKGLVSPYKGIYNPYENAGRSTTMNNWRVRNDVLTLNDGYAAITSLTLTSRLKMLASYKSSTRNDLIYVDGRNLKYWDLDAGSGGTVISNMLSSDYMHRIGWIRFRNRFLLGTYSDGLFWYDAENRTGRLAGVVAPVSAPSLAAGGAGVLTGVYTGWVSYVNDQSHESQTSAASGTLNAVANTITWTIPTGPTGTSSRKLYRSTAGGATKLLLTTISDNTTTSYSDNNADSALGSAHEGNFTVPTTGIRNIAASATRVYLVDTDGKTVWASKIDTSSGLPNWEAFPSSLSVTYPFVGGQDVALAAVPIGQVVFVWGNLSGFRTLGNVATTAYTEPLPWPIGFFSAFSWSMTRNGLMFIDNEKKFRIFDGANTPKEIGEKVWNIADGMKVDAGMDGPDVTYDEPSKCVHVSYGTVAASANTKTLLYFLDKDEAATSDWASDVAYYSHTDKIIYMAKQGATAMYKASGYQAAGTNFSSQSVEFLPITPVAGDKSYFIRMVLAVKAQPIVSGVIPMLKIEYALDDGGIYETKYADISKDYIVIKAGDANVKRIIEIPLYKRAESIAVRISPANNTASVTNGCEIYTLALHWKPSAEAKMGGRMRSNNPGILSVNGQG